MPAHISAHTSLSTPDLDAFQLHLTPFNSTPTPKRGAWRPKPIDVDVGGFRFVAFVTPKFVKTLPSGDVVVDVVARGGGGGSAAGGAAAAAAAGAASEDVGDQSTIIVCEPKSDGTNVFMFGLTRTVLPNGCVLYSFPGGGRRSGGRVDATERRGRERESDATSRLTNT